MLFITKILLKIIVVVVSIFIVLWVFSYDAQFTFFLMIILLINMIISNYVA